MRRLLIRSVLAAALVVVGIGAVVPTVSADPGPGTFTTITTPKAMIFPYDSSPGAVNSFVVTGKASSDVTSVDILCLYHGSLGVTIYTLAAGVPVSGGNFSTVAILSSFTTSCRLRAVPTGLSIDDTTYLNSYAGPVFLSNTFIVNKDGSSIPYGLTAVAEQGDGLASLSDAAACGVSIITTVETPSMALRGNNGLACSFALTGGNVSPTGTTSASAIKVSGHNAFLPGAVHNYLISTLGLTLTQSQLTTTFKRAANGDLTITESAPLMRCSVSDTYPPTSGSCPSLTSTGVTFKRTTNIFRGGHQARLRDTYTATDGATHPLSLQYQLSNSGAVTGALGYVFPGHGSTFKQASKDQVVTFASSKAATMLVRSDIYAAPNDLRTDTLGFSWSRAPLRVRISHTSAGFLGLDYSASVGVGKPASLGFAETEKLLTTDTSKLAAVATGEMVNVPAISSPANGAIVKGQSTTVKGKLTAGANGLPTKVSVNGHAAKITRTGSATATYSVTFTESYAVHKITVVATDSGGNTKARTISVRNKHP